MRWPVLLLLALSACAPVSQNELTSRTMIADTTLPPMKTFANRTPRPLSVSNEDLARDFLDLSFQLESGTPVAAFTRFEGPITLRVTGSPPSTLDRDLALLFARLRSEANIDIQRVTDPSANITVEAVPRTTLQRALPQAACFVAPNVSSLTEFKRARRSPKTNWATLQTRQTALIVLPNDVSPQEVRDCLHEELAQALGPLNDLYHLPNSVFNDDNVHAILTDFDMLILKATYQPDLASGLSRAEVSRRLPALFDRINPRGRFPAQRIDPVTPQTYVRAIQTALGPGTVYAERVDAADEAVQIARTQGWTDVRRGFAHYAKGQVLRSTDAPAALEELQQADGFYARSRETRLHRAFVASQLATYALIAQDPSRARRLVTPHINTAHAAQNAALLTTLHLIHAEALAAEGQISAANAERLDSLGWARYGFGADWAVQTKLREISELGTAGPSQDRPG